MQACCRAKYERLNMECNYREGCNVRFLFIQEEIQYHKGDESISFCSLDALRTKYEDRRNLLSADCKR
jgi:hypothetical protein